MSPSKKTQQKWALASIALQDAYTDFILSRQAMLCSEQTLKWYGFTAGRFVKWLQESSIHHPTEITARHVRLHLAELVGQGMKDSSVNGHARAIKTLIKFLHAEEYIADEPKFTMPTVAKKRLPMVTAEELKRVLAACTKPRDIALIMLLAGLGATEGGTMCAQLGGY